MGSLVETSHTPFGFKYDTDPGVKFAANHMGLPVSIVCFYLMAIYSFSKYMNDPFIKPFNLKKTLTYWNASLSLFSFIGSITTTYTLLNIINESKHMKDTICMNPSTSWGNGWNGLWVELFIFSKIPELGDTFFIIARKRPLSFLHWYHHVTVLLYCWHSFATGAPQALYFVAMNYSVHSVMYGYYCLMCLNMKPKWLPPIIITTAQITQMIVGTTIQLLSSYYYLYPDKKSCNLNGNNIFWGAIMYASYFGLFTHFAIKRYYTLPKNLKIESKKSV